MRAELKQAFRLFDKQGTGFITMAQFRSIVAEVDPNLTEEDPDPETMRAELKQAFRLFD